MIITTVDKSVGINFSKISFGEYHSHEIYRNWLGLITLKITFLESGLRSSSVLKSYKFRFDNYDDAKHVIDTYIKTLN